MQVISRTPPLRTGGVALDKVNNEFSEPVGGAAHFYIGDEEEPADEAAVAKEKRRKDVAEHWMELEKIEARFGHPLRLGRKWLRRNNMNIEIELEAAGREKATENAAPEAENVVVELEVTGRGDDMENAAPEEKVTRQKKKKIKKKVKPVQFVNALD